eukprot:COSAG01_NODE_66009_length_271_cov_1.127907_1_plen_28_part_01
MWCAARRTGPGGVRSGATDGEEVLPAWF